jgi:hypothetical protein
VQLPLQITALLNDGCPPTCQRLLVPVPAVHWLARCRQHKKVAAPLLPGSPACLTMRTGRRVAAAMGKRKMHGVCVWVRAVAEGSHVAGATRQEGASECACVCLSVPVWGAGAAIRRGAGRGVDVDIGVGVGAGGGPAPAKGNG